MRDVCNGSRKALTKQSREKILHKKSALNQLFGKNLPKSDSLILNVVHKRKNNDEHKNYGFQGMKKGELKPASYKKIFVSDKPYREPDGMILDLSMTYIRVARMIYESKLEDWRSPFIVNASFAIELYLKSMQKGKKIYGPPLLVSFGTESIGSKKSQKIVHSKSEISYKGNGHNLINLFSQIPARNRDYTLHIFSQPYHNIDFKTFLEEYSKAFVSWRYCYEGKTETFSPEKVLIVLKVLEDYRASLSRLDQEIPVYEV